MLFCKASRESISSATKYATTISVFPARNTKINKPDWNLTKIPIIHLCTQFHERQCTVRDGIVRSWRTSLREFCKPMKSSQAKVSAKHFGVACRQSYDNRPLIRRHGEHFERRCWLWCCVTVCFGRCFLHGWGYDWNQNSLPKSNDQYSTNIYYLFIYFEGNTCDVPCTRLCEVIRSNFPKLDWFDAKAKRMFSKAPSRKQLFKAMHPDHASPSQPITTRWGTWLGAVDYYSEYDSQFEDVVNSLDSSDAASIGIVQTLLLDIKLRSEHIFVAPNYAYLNVWINKKPHARRTLKIVTDAIARMDSIEYWKSDRHFLMFRQKTQVFRLNIRKWKPRKDLIHSQRDALFWIRADNVCRHRAIVFDLQKSFAGKSTIIELH